jgi:hypothetical protein
MTEEEGLKIIKRHRANEIRNHGQICPTLTESRDHHGGANPPMVMRPEDKTKKALVIEDFYQNRAEPREYEECSPTLRADRQGLKVMTIPDTERFGLPTSTNMQQPSTITDSARITPPQTSERLTYQQFQTLICSVEDFLAKHSASLESGEVSTIPEEPCFSKFAESLKLKNLRICSLRTSKVLKITRKGKLSESSSAPWGNWIMTFRSFVLTADFMESPRTAKDSSLSAILETDPDPKYFLSDKAKKSLMEWQERQKREGRGWKAKFHPQSTQTIGRGGEEGEVSL